MKICPNCREEFLDEIRNCTDCLVPLVTSLENLSRDSSERFSKEELFSGEMLPFVEAGLVQCREVEKILLRAKIACAVYPVSIAATGNETLGTTSDGKYMVLIREIDIDGAKQAMEGKFHADVAKEGKGVVALHAIDLEQGEITCPACGEIGPLIDGECRICGLHLGV